MANGLRFTASSLAKVNRNLRLVAGKADRIVGSLKELMEYAPRVELGQGKVPPKPHMRPAFMMMVAKALPKMAAVLKAALAGPLKDYDCTARNAVAAAMYEMEGYRVTKLRELVYTRERLERQRQEGYRGYKLTGNLMQNRIIEVKAYPSSIGLNIRKDKNALGRVEGVPGGS